LAAAAEAGAVRVLSFARDGPVAAIAGGGTSRVAVGLLWAATQYTLHSAELEALLGEFRKRGIEPVVLKGMAVCSTAYPSPGTRPTSDLDVLIQRSQVKAIRQLLAARGYCDKGLDQGQRIAFAHHLHMWRPSLGGHHMVVEAHWELVHDPGYARRLDVQGFMARTARMNSRDGSAQALDPVDQLIYACAHLLLHHLHDWSLLWLLDLRLLVARRGAGWDWRELVDRAERYKLAGTLRYWLDLTEAWYGPFLPPQATQALAAARVSPEERWYIATARVGSARQWKFVWRRAWTRRICARRPFTFERLYFHRGPICNIAMALARAGWRRCTTAGDLSGPGGLPSAGLDRDEAASSFSAAFHDLR